MEVAEMSEIAQSEEPKVTIEGLTSRPKSETQDQKINRFKNLVSRFKRGENNVPLNEAKEEAEAEQILDSLGMSQEEKHGVEDLRKGVKALKAAGVVVNYLNPSKTPGMRLVYTALGVSLLGSIIDCKVPRETLQYLEGFSKLSPDHLQILSGIIGGGSGGYNLNEAFAQDKSVKSKALWTVLGAAAGVLPVEVNALFHGPTLANAAIGLTDEIGLAGSALAATLANKSKTESKKAPALAQNPTQLSLK